jgi:SAM-dependent methyltransferase
MRHQAPATTAEPQAPADAEKPAAPETPAGEPGTGSVRLIPPAGSSAATAPPGATSRGASNHHTPATPAGPTTPPAAPPATTSHTAATAPAATAPLAAPTAPPAIELPAAAVAPAGQAAANAPRAADSDLFVRHTRAYVADSLGQRISILNAGCATATELGTEALRAEGADVTVSLIEEDGPATRATVARDASLSECIVGDLRTVPLQPRAFDIVQCSSLLERIMHAELVLDRLVEAIKPGGILLLRVGDRDSAGGFLDRVLPQPARRLIWRRRRPGEPGPYPAVYDELASTRGIQAYALLRGLVVAERGALGGLAGGLPPGPPGFLPAQKLVAWLSRGRLTADHEELLYVMRKPESRFARVL